MSKSIKRIVFKIVLFIIVCCIVEIAVTAIAPTIDADVAVAQLNGDDYGFVQLVAYEKLQNAAAYLPILIGLGMFCKEIVNLIKLVIKKLKETK